MLSDLKPDLGIVPRYPFSDGQFSGDAERAFLLSEHPLRYLPEPLVGVILKTQKQFSHVLGCR
jgi:hypothetical protein